MRTPTSTLTRYVNGLCAPLSNVNFQEFESLQVTQYLSYYSIFFIIIKKYITNGEIFIMNRPSSPKHKKGAQTLFHDDTKSSHRDLEYHVRQVKHALTHFKDVINKNKLEMLPGNGTILLETIANINAAMKSHKYHPKSSAVISATQQVQSVLGKLIKLCDDALISEDEENFIALNKDNAKELVEQLIDGITVSIFF